MWGDEDDDGDELAAQPTVLPPAQLHPTFGDFILHATADADQGGTEDDGDDGDQLTAQPPVPPPATRRRQPAPRPRGRPRGRAWAPPPTHRPNAAGRQPAEPSPALSTRLPTRHTRRGSELAPPPKRPRPLRGEGEEEEEGDAENEGEGEEDAENEGEEEEESPTRRNDGSGTRVTRRSNRVISRGRTRAGIDNSPDSSPHETPRRRLRSRAVRNPSSTTRATRPAAAQQKPKYYNSEFRKRITQPHHLGRRTTLCPHCQAYMWKDELPAGGSMLNPSFEVCCKHGKVKMPRPDRSHAPMPTPSNPSPWLRKSPHTHIMLDLECTHADPFKPVIIPRSKGHLA